MQFIFTYLATTICKDYEINVNYSASLIILAKIISSFFQSAKLGTIANRNSKMDTSLLFASFLPFQILWSWSRTKFIYIW